MYEYINKQQPFEEVSPETNWNDEEELVDPREEINE